MNYFGDEEEVWVMDSMIPSIEHRPALVADAALLLGKLSVHCLSRHHITLLPLTEFQVHNTAPWPRLPPAPHLAPSLAFSQGLLLSHFSRL